MRYGAFDTETINRPGHGEACLLIKMVESGPEYLEFPQSFDEIFNFITGRRWVAWNMDFDARAIVHDNFLPYAVVEDLAIYGHSRHRDYNFEYKAGKYLRVSKTGAGLFEIFDLAQFYASSLSEAAKKYLGASEQKKEIPKRWYSEMDLCLLDKRRDTIIDYAVQDVKVTQALADRLILSFSKAGIKTRRLSSCAGLAKQKWGRKFLEVRPPDYLNRVFERGFFGGRIEVARLGVGGACKLYDIHSAYPSEMAKLVDPRGRLISGKNNWTNRGAAYGVYDVDIDVPLGDYFGPCAYRHGVGVVYPVGLVKTTICLPAIEVLTALKIPFVVRSYTEIIQDDKTPLFPEIAGLYESRKDPDAGLAIKTMLNSAYGVLAESTRYRVAEVLAYHKGVRDVGGRLISSRTRYGRYTNYILAAHITEAVRMRVYRVLRAYGRHVLMSATDGVLLEGAAYTGKDIGPNLGQIGLAGSYQKSVIFGCGRYYLEGVEGSMLRLRGFTVGPKIVDRLKNCKRSYLPITMLQGKSMLQWAGLPGESLNVLRDVKRELRIEDEKRHWPERVQKISHVFERAYMSMPYIVGV